MKEPRVLTSLGMVRWRDVSPVLDAHLSNVILENITARLAVVGRDNRYLYANREMLDFLGHPADKVIGSLVSDVIGEVAYAGYRPLSERVFAGEAISIEGWVDY